MKLRPRTFQIFWDVHAWAGVVGALLLHVMFFMGAFALFHKELDAWAQAAPAATGAPEPPGRLQPLVEQLEREEGIIGADSVDFMPEPTGLRAFWKRGQTSRSYVFSMATGRLEPVGSELGSFLYSMHYLGPLPKGIYVAGLAAMALFLALVTGLFIHLKDLLRHWFVFRPERARRTWSSDLHKVLGVFGLPYQLLYAWSGAVLCLASVAVEPTVKAALFGGDERAASLTRGDLREATGPPSGRLTGELPDLDRIVARAIREVPGLRASWIRIERPGDESSSVSVSGDLDGLAFGTADVILRARDGSIVRAPGPRRVTAYRRFEAWFFGLHYASFGGHGIRMVYALLALATCAVILTGNVVWLERRDKRRVQLGNRILERLTVAAGAGVVVATAGLFLGNRLFAASGTSRQVAEQAVFWSTWAASAIVPLFWRADRRSAGALLAAASALFAAAILVDVTTRAAAPASGLHRAVDAVLMVVAGACGLAAARLLLGRATSTAPSREA